MIDSKVEKPVDPEDEEAAKKFLFGPEVKQTPSTSSEGRSRRSVDPLDKAGMKFALDQGYRGVYLLRPEDFGEDKIIKNNISNVIKIIRNKIF